MRPARPRYEPPGTLGVLRLLALTAVRRVFRAAKINKQKKAMESGGHDGAAGTAPRKRTATHRKRGDGLMWLMLLLVPLFIFQGIVVTSNAVEKMRVAAEMAHPAGDRLYVERDLYRALRSARPLDEAKLRDVADEFDLDEASRPSRTVLFDFWQEHGDDRFFFPSGRHDLRLILDEFQWGGDAARAVFLKLGALMLFGLTIAMLAVSLGGANATLAGGGWTQAWLMGFPVATRSLVLARALEYSLVQFFPWFTIGPLCFQWLSAMGQPHALWIAILLTLLTTTFIGSIRLWLETTLRLRLSLHGLKNVQGACTILALGMMALVFGVGLGPGVPNFFIDVADALPEAITVLPGAWPLGLSMYGGVAWAIGLLATAAVFAMALMSTSRQLRGGMMRTGGVDAGKRGKSFDWTRHAKRLGVAGKEMLMLRRDRNFMVQTLLVPVFVVGMQLLVNPGLSKAKGVGVVMISYFVGMYGCLFGCFQVLSGEGRALWMLYSLPVSIAEVLRRKMRIWASLSLTFAIGALAAFALVGTFEPWQFAVEAILLAIGVWCTAHIAAGIGVIGANPNADHVPKQPKQRHVALFFLFGSTYFAVLWADDLVTRLAGALTFVTLAYAIWQRACDRVQWLLDPVDEPRDHITLFDGGAAVLIFYAVMTVVVQIMRLIHRNTQVSLLDVNYAFAITGGIVALLFTMIMSLRGVVMTRALGFTARKDTAARSLVAAVLAGVGLGMVGLAYVGLVKDYQLFELPEARAGERQQMLILACFFAPLIEEVLFRGMVFNGLLRTVKLPLAVVWSALLFAFMHGPHSWPPVFLLGVATALLYHRTRFLPAAMLLHATYNYVVVAYQ